MCLRLSSMAPRTLLAYSVILLLVVGGFAYYYFPVTPPPQEPSSYTPSTVNYRSSAEYKAANDQLTAGNYEQAVTSFQKLAETAPTPAAYAASMTMLAYSLYGNGDIGGAAEAYKIQIRNEKGNTPAGVALALNELGFITDLVEDNPEILEKYIYNTPPYSDYLKKANGNYFMADIEIFKQADALYPTAWSKYEIAYKEARLLYAALNDTSNPGSVNMQDLATDIQANVLAGDKLIATEPVLASVLSNAPAMWSQLYVFRAFALDHSNRVLKTLSDAHVNEAYELALPFVDGDLGNVQNQTMAANARFFYAASLIAREGETAKARIVSLLSFFGNPSQTGKGGLSSANFIKYVSLDDPRINPLTSEIVRLAALSPEFKKFVLQAGAQL